MSTKEAVLDQLNKKQGDFVSGSDLATQLGVSRNSVWKAINALRDEGFEIESITNRGYRIVAAPSIYSAQSIARLIKDPRVNVEFLESVSSTNIRAKELAEAGASEGTLVVAETQSSGRGRQGRAFYSPPGTGVYFSLVLRPRFSLSDVALITSFAACCLAEAIDACTDKHAQIKWVNDVFVEGRKVSGILSEASFDAETQTLSHVVVGIGVNVIEPEGGFADASDIAGALVQEADDVNALRTCLVAETVSNFMRDYERIPQRPHIDEYRRRAILDGRRVHVISGNEEFDAIVLGVNADFTLQVMLDNGKERTLASGEVHIPSGQLLQ